MSPDGRGASLASQPGSVQPARKRRRVAVACLSCRNRKSRCGGQRPKCSTCTELDLKCEYLSSGNQQGPNPGLNQEHLERVESRLHNLEKVVRGHLSNLPESCRNQTEHRNTRSPNHGPVNVLNQSQTPTTSSHPTYGSTFIDEGDDEHEDEDVNDQIGDEHQPEDPTDGMGHFVFADEEDRAFFGPSSSIAFTSEVSVALARLSHPPEGRNGFTHQSHSHYKTFLPDYRIARIPRRKSIDTHEGSQGQSRPRRNSAGWTNGGVSPLSSFYLPPEEETSGLINRFFSDTALLFPYIHEEAFRETYAKLRQGNLVAMRRTWLGLLNMILAIATYTTVSPIGDAASRQSKSEAFYRRATRLCESHVMKTASLEIVQYLLLASQYMQGNKSSVQTSATHGLAVKIAMQLGLHSTEASKRFPPMEREIRKRVWFGCIVLDRSLSMTFGRPASIPETYCRLELPTYLDSFHIQEQPPSSIKISHDSTDFYRATISLYSVMGNVIDLLYGGNLGCGEKLPNYELTIAIMKVRRMLEEWARQLPPHMGLIRDSELMKEVASDFTLARFRVILTLRFNNLRVLALRIVLVRVCELVAGCDAAENIDLMELRDVTGSAVEGCVGSSAEIVNLVRYAVRDDSGPGRQLLGAWWFTLYYVFDAAMVLFTILLLLRRSHSIVLPPTISQDAIQEAFLNAIETLSRLDHSNITVDRCFWCLKKLALMLGISDGQHKESDQWRMPTSTTTNLDSVPTLFQADFMDQGLSFLDFDFMGNERLDFMGDYGENAHDM